MAHIFQLMHYDMQISTPVSITTAFGHFGVADRPWEQTDLVPLLQQLAQEI